MLRVYTNRRAHHEYELLDRFEAGISLTGSEVKSVRAGGVDFRDAFARVVNGNVELEGLYIPPTPRPPTTTTSPAAPAACCCTARRSASCAAPWTRRA